MARNMTAEFGKAFDKFPMLAAQRKEVIEQIARSMESGDFNWAKSWSEIASPHNPASGHQYSGSNRLNLSLLAFLKGYGDPRWVTYNQAKKNGWEFKSADETKRYAYVEHWSEKPFYKRDEDGAYVLDEDGKRILEGYYLSLNRYSRVYNAEQFSNFPELEKQLTPNLDHDFGQMADDLINSSRCEVVERVTALSPCYSPLHDEIVLPLRDQFDSNASFIGTLLHEMAHSTMHPDALNRVEGTAGRFGSESYAKEELVAELSSVFSSADLGIESALDEESDHYQNHVAYLASWSKAIRDDPMALYTAAGKAEQATKYIVARYDDVLAARNECRELARELDKAKGAYQKQGQAKASLADRMPDIQTYAAGQSQDIPSRIEGQTR